MHKGMGQVLASLGVCLLVMVHTGCAEYDQEEAEPILVSYFEDPPLWARHAIWYQIMVERFRNGDPDNDPRIEDIEVGFPGFAPASWRVTPWTQDWYREDPYFAEVYGRQDMAGNTLEDFQQISRLRRYGGDLQGVLDKVDYLDSLGVTAIYFNPLNDAPSYHKYDARHWRHIDRNFGPDPEGDLTVMAAETPDDPSTWEFTSADYLFVDVIEAFHARDIKVIMDFSWNHTGQDFWALKDVRENGEASKFKDWYWIESYDDPDTPEDEFAYQGWFGVVDLAEMKETVWHDPSKPLAAYESDLASASLKQHIFNVAGRWLDPDGDGDPSDGVDGFRLDVAAEIGLEFWRDFRKEVLRINPEAYLLGEVWWEEWPDKLMDPEAFLEGDVFDAVMNYRWYRSARHYFAAAPDRIPVSEMVDSLQRFASNLRPKTNAAMMNLAASHDSPHVLTSLFNRENKYKVGVAATPDNDYKLHKPDAETFETLRLLLAQQFTYVGAPHIWAGAEMGMWSADYTRKPVIWPDLTFESESRHPFGMPRPVDAVVFDSDLFAYYQRLIHIRKQHSVLSTGDLSYLLVDDDKDLLAYSRFDPESELIAVFNAGYAVAEFMVPAKFGTTYTDLLDHATVRPHNDSLAVRLPGRKAAILGMQ